MHQVETFVGVFIGAVTFTGSVIAFGKLQGVHPQQAAAAAGDATCSISRPSALCVVLGRVVCRQPTATPIWPLVIATVLASLVGIHLVMAIGGADMPVVVSMLNSYSGWAAAAAGFMLSNDLLIITGRTRRLERRDSQLHHVRGDEPFVPERHSRRLRRRGRRGSRRGRRARAARSGASRRRRRRMLLLQAKRVIIVPGLRNGGGAGAVSACSMSRSCCASTASTSGSRFIRSRDGCPGT